MAWDLKEKILDSAHSSSREALIGGEIVFYAPRKRIVVEVRIFFLLI